MGDGGASRRPCSHALPHRDASARDDPAAADIA